jgi:hypothetical protein
MYALLLVIAGHHGISNFDLNKDLTLSGKVTRVDFVNPHSWLYVDVKDANGKAANWRCEMRANTVLRRSGWTPEMFKVGSTVTITGSPDRTAPNTCYLGTVTFADGSSYESLRASRRASHVCRTAIRTSRGTGPRSSG